MRILPAAVALVLISCAGKSGEPTEPRADDGDVKGPCRSLQARISGLYREAAVTEGIAPNLVEDFVSANLHMVMADCNALPAQVAPCLQSAQSVESIEKVCVLPLDDEGLVEGRQFSNK